MMDFPDRSAQEIPHHTLSLPALTTLDIDLQSDPSPRLITILSSISSAPALGSITFRHDKWSNIDQSSFQGTWVDMDRLLTWMAQRARVQGGFSVTLKWWPKDKPVWEGFLRDFRRSGGQVKTYVHS